MGVPDPNIIEGLSEILIENLYYCMEYSEL